jgi:hypothetical protein
MAVKTWVWVVVALAVLALVGLIALIAAGAYFVAREIDTKPASKASAEQEFNAERTRFGDQKPLIEIDEDDRAIRSSFDPNQPPAATKPEVMVVMAWDPEDERIVRVRLPFWLLRLGSRNRRGGSLNLGSNSRIDFERLNISVQDLERLGPALIVDHRSTHGERVLIWTQ